MNYRLVYTRRAEKDIKKLDSSVKRTIGKSLLKLQDNPIQYSEKLTDPRIGTYRFRIGDYYGKSSFHLKATFCAALFAGVERVVEKCLKDSRHYR
jgi:mRNA interferase RelE/StbE